MRHRVDHRRRLSRTSEHRMALRRNMAQSLIEHGSITTTVAKAKNLRPFFERLVTLALQARSSDKGSALQARRSIESLLVDRAIIPKEHRAAYEGMSDAARTRSVRMVSGRRYRTGEPKGRLEFTADSVTRRLIHDIAPRYKNRAGGYTRMVLLPKWRIGDAGFLAMVQLVGDEDAPTSLTKPARSARRRRTDARYEFAVKTAKARAGKARAESAKVE